jgi:hypothetical protein
MPRCFIFLPFLLPSAALQRKGGDMDAKLVANKTRKYLDTIGLR